MTRSASTWARPNERTLGCRSAARRGTRTRTPTWRCRPRPVTAFTEPTARSASGTSALTSVDLPTPDWPTSTEVTPASDSTSGPSKTSVRSGRRCVE